MDEWSMEDRQRPEIEQDKVQEEILERGGPDVLRKT